MEGVQFVYFEKVLLINVFMNFLILWITSRLIREPLMPFRFLLGAILGGLYSFSLIIPALSVGVNFVSKLLFSLVMVRISYPWKGRRIYGKTLVYFYLTSFAFGGTIIALSNFVSQQRDLDGMFNNFWQIVWGDIYWIVPVFLIGVVSFGYWAPLIQRAILHQVYLFKVAIAYQGKTLETKGFLDSGNQLRDPMTQRPVILLDQKIVKEILGENLAIKIQETNELEPWQRILVIQELDPEWSGWRIIPYCAVGKQEGKLLAFTLDQVVIFEAKGQKRFDKVIAAISDTPLSTNNQYEVLLHGDFLIS